MPEKPGTRQLKFRAASRLAQRARVCAAVEGITLSTFLRRAVLHACERSESGEIDAESGWKSQH